MPGPNATITHQAIENLAGRRVTRCWSRWTDGSVTHSDSEHDRRTGVYFVNIGTDRDMLPPAGVDTVAIRGTR